LWRRYKIWRGIEDDIEELVTSPNHSEIGGKSPRYYQQLAINRTIEAVAKGQKRALLVMATGTGKTYTAFNIIWRLWKSGQAKRVLFLADRNILVDQTIVNDFKPFGEAMTKLTRKLVDRAAAGSTSPTRSTSRSTRRSWATRSTRRSTTSSRATSSTSS
jgi:type I restriction enzyme, R subunit